MKKENIIYLAIGSLFIVGIIIVIYNIFTVDTITHKTTSKVEKKEEIVKKDSKDKVNNVQTKEVESVEEDSSFKKGEKYRIPKVFIEKNNLPPYPGKDGGPGVYGTDANNNNIRDDLEREIAWVFRNNPEVRDMFYADVVSQKLDMDLAVNKDYSPESNREMKRRVSAVLGCEEYYLDKKKYSGFKTLSEEQQSYNFGKRYYYSTPERKKMTDSYESGILKSESFAGSMEELKAFKNRGRKPGEMSADEESNYRDQHPEMMEEFCKNLVSDLLNK